MLLSVVISCRVLFLDDNRNDLYNKQSCLGCFRCRVFIGDDKRNDLYHKQSCLGCFCCRVFIWDDNRNNVDNMPCCSQLLSVVVYCFLLLSGKSSAGRRMAEGHPKPDEGGFACSPG